MNSSTFIFKDSTITTISKDGGVWFVASDVCKALDIQNHRDALTRLDDDEKGVVTTDTLGGPQRVTAVNESGVYHLIFKSRKASAKEFRRWITGEVIPAIRLHGGYVMGVEKLSDDQQARTVQLIREEVRRVAGVIASEEREARRMGLDALRGRMVLVKH